MTVRLQVPGSDHETVRKQAAGPARRRVRDLDGEDILSVSSPPNLRLAAALVTAYSHHLVDE